MVKTLELDEILAKAVSDSVLPGVVAYVKQGKNILYEGAFGNRDTEKKNEITVDSIFWLASMTKAITSIAAMQLVEQGKITLDVPLNQIVPELNDIQVMLGVDENRKPILREPKKEITLRHLLTHTSGFTYPFSNKNTIYYIKANKLDISAGKNESIMTPLAFDPGERWNYGVSTDWVGKTIEAVSGLDLRSYFEKYIFQPLGMKDTDFIIQPEQRERLVRVHVRGEDGELYPIDHEYPQDPEFFMGGAGLYSTAEDYTKFLQMILHRGSYNGEQILQPETVYEIRKNQIGELNVTPMISFNPSLTIEHEIFPGMIKKWGLFSLITTEDAPTGRREGSMSWSGVANTHFWIDPKTGITAVFLTQLFPFADEKVMEVFERFETKVYDIIS